MSLLIFFILEYKKIYNKRKRQINLVDNFYFINPFWQISKLDYSYRSLS